MLCFYLTATLAALAAAAPPSLEPRQSSQLITVNSAQKFQIIDGFGFSAAFQRANLIVNLAEPKQSEVLNLLYNTSSGAGFSILRNGIGSSIDSRNDWMNTILPVCPSSPSGTFNYKWDGKDSGQLWLSQKGVEFGVKQFYANAWSAPGCMKTNGNDANGGSLCGVSGASCASGDWKQAYANYLVKYIQLYIQSGVPITHVGFLNEPDYTASYASMLSSGTQAADFIKVLRPTLDRNNLTSVGINCCEGTGWNVANQHASQIASAGALSSVYAITSHEYSSRINNPLSTRARAWQTEYSDLNGGWSTAWYSNGGAGDGYTWANTVFNGVVSANLSAYIFWEGVQDRATNNNNNEKLILIDGQNYYVSKRLWAFAQFRIVRPEAVRVSSSISSGGGNQVKSGAFVNKDGSVAVVAINSGSGAQTIGVKLQEGSLEGRSVRAWYTDNSKDMGEVQVSVAADGSSASASVPGRAMVSFLIAAPAGK